MHEVAITKSLLAIALDKAAESGVKRIRTIRLRVGELTGYVPEAVEQNFAIFAEGTAAEGATLVIVPVPLRCACKRCGCEYQGKPYDFTCADCGAADITITGGREMFIESMEVET